MNVLMLLVFVGVAMVTLALVLFAWTLRSRTFDQSDRLALLPLAEDARPALARANPAPVQVAHPAQNPRTGGVSNGTQLEGAASTADVGSTSLEPSETGEQRASGDNS